MVTVGLVSRGGTDGTRGEFYRLSLVVLIAFARDDGNGSLIGSVLDAALEHDLDIYLHLQRPPKIERLANFEPIGRCKIPLN